MRVAIYDRNPGVGAGQFFLRLAWQVGCFLHRLLGNLDAYYGAATWDEAIRWLLAQKRPLTSIQYWGHGSSGVPWLAQMAAAPSVFYPLRAVTTSASLLWFRACNVFQGQRGYDFSKAVADGIGCTIAGHTRVIGFLQSGLHTRRPTELPRWPLTEGDVGPAWRVNSGLQCGSNTIVCLRATVPSGW